MTISIHDCVCLCVRTFIHTHMHNYTSVRLCIHSFVHMDVCLYFDVCMRVYVSVLFDNRHTFEQSNSCDISCERSEKTTYATSTMINMYDGNNHDNNTVVKISIAEVLVSGEYLLRW